MNIFLKEKDIFAALEKAKDALKKNAEDIINRALKRKGLTPQETAVLLQCEDSETINKIFAAARKIKESIYGKRLVLFAPLYTTNECVNNCLYCAFRKANKELKRRTLTLEEIKEEIKVIEGEGHKRILLVAGEDPKSSNISNLEKIIGTIYNTKNGRGEIRRLNVNVAPLSIKNFKRLKKTGIGTYQLFQETYHRSTYFMVHPGGPKEDYKYRLFAMDRAVEAGIDDVGIGVLFGLYDYKFEVLGLVSHAQHMEKKNGVGPHTISVPRFCPAETVNLNLPYRVSDRDFLKIISVLRLAVPYTGMILSTREGPEIREKAFQIGISQASAASATSPGGYGDGEQTAQFFLHDHRGVDEVVQGICLQGQLPSFCTACYRSKRTGDRFMKLAKSGEIQNFCQPNAILTFKEYLLDYASPETRAIGERVIEKELQEILREDVKKECIRRLKRLGEGARDIYF